MEAVLSDNLRKKATEKIRMIAEYLYKRNITDCSLMYGTMGIAIFLFYYWQWKKQNSFYKKAAELVRSIFMELNKQIYLYKQNPSEIDLTFSTGLCGIGWGINHLIKSDFIECDIQETMCMIDAAIYRKMTNGLHSQDKKDFMEALAIGLYAINRDDRLSKEYLCRFIKEWIELADQKKQIHFDGFIRGNDRIARYLWHKITDKYPDIIPSSASRIFYATESKISYHETDILSFKEKISGLTVDSGMARGLAATGHQANRRYRQSGSSDFREIAKTCFETLLERTIPENNLFWYTASQGLWRQHDGLANGLAGIGLALIATVTDDETTWDECLLTIQT
jgi:lantibiotic modifying enzyme